MKDICYAFSELTKIQKEKEDTLQEILLDIMNDTGEVPKLPEGAQDWKGKTIIEVPKFPTSFDGHFIEDYWEEPKCACGADSIGVGLHSDWCNKYEE